jgi:hypothetical protein
VDQQVGVELLGVLLPGHVAERQVHGALQHAVGADRGDRLLGGVVPGALGVVAEQVALEAVADRGDGPAREQRHRPAHLVDQVVHQRAHVPLGARRRQVPLVVPDGVHPRAELPDRPLVQLPHVVAHHALPVALVPTWSRGAPPPGC